MSEAKDQDPATCPVDHKSREAWLSQARAAAGGAPPSHPPIPTASPSTPEPETCPVDHKAREAWMRQAARAAEPSRPLPSTSTSAPIPSSANSSWTSYLPHLPFLSSKSSSDSTTTPPPPPHAARSITTALATEREVSTIPRSSTPGDAACPPANQEQETGADYAGGTGNWIYPSERMFFEAMKRKGHDPQATDMRTVVPIHNAVNERAWAEIKGWEEPWVRGSSCGGPRLHSFSGLSTNMSPRARINTMLGYQAPFDRHDWVVDRCGKEIEYVIDFYAGRNSTPGGKLSFYLDVRPKLNTWEGIKMRAMRAAGLA
ncbi:cytochrome c and c1 heme-lyase [Whalleya microplaca]|nr:cytochrome c and c1 heme-lyase [Whalleya microplaca]